MQYSKVGHNNSTLCARTILHPQLLTRRHQHHARSNIMTTFEGIYFDMHLFKAECILADPDASIVLYLVLLVLYLCHGILSFIWIIQHSVAESFIFRVRRLP